MKTKCHTEEKETAVKIDRVFYYHFAAHVYNGGYYEIYRQVLPLKRCDRSAIAFRSASVHLRRNSPRRCITGGHRFISFFFSRRGFFFSSLSWKEATMTPAHQSELSNRRLDRWRSKIGISANWLFSVSTTTSTSPAVPSSLPPVAWEGEGPFVRSQ